MVCENGIITAKRDSQSTILGEYKIRNVKQVQVTRGEANRKIYVLGGE